MAERKTYAVHWKIEGRTRVEATSEAEAEQKFNGMNVRDLAEEGELTTEEVVEEKPE